MHKVSRRRLASTVAQLLREQPKNRSHTLQMLAAYLIEHKQQKQLDLLLLDIAHELAVSDGHLYAEVSSAHPLDAAARAELQQYLTNMTGARVVELNEQVDAELLAGLVVRIADQELDTSARTKLDKLKSLNVNTTSRA